MTGIMTSTHQVRRRLRTWQIVPLVAAAGAVALLLVVQARASDISSDITFHLHGAEAGSEVQPGTDLLTVTPSEAVAVGDQIRVTFPEGTLLLDAAEEHFTLQQEGGAATPPAAFSTATGPTGYHFALAGESLAADGEGAITLHFSGGGDSTLTLPGEPTESALLAVEIYAADEVRDSGTVDGITFTGEPEVTTPEPAAVVLSSDPEGDVTAGAPITVEVTLVDDAGSPTDTGGELDVTFTGLDQAPAGIPATIDGRELEGESATVELDFDNGLAEVEVVAFLAADGQTLEVTAVASHEGVTSDAEHGEHLTLNVAPDADSARLEFANGDPFGEHDVVAAGDTLPEATVQVEDEWGNIVDGHDFDISVALGAGIPFDAIDDALTADSATLLTTGNGAATFGSLTPAIVGENLRLQFDAEGADLLESASFDMSPGAPSALTSTFSAIDDDAETGQPITLMVWLYDEFENAVNEQPEDFAVALVFDDAIDNPIAMHPAAAHVRVHTFIRDEPGEVNVRAFIAETDDDELTLINQIGGSGYSVTVEFTGDEGHPNALPVEREHEVEQALSDDAATVIETEASDGSTVRVEAPAGAIPGGGSIVAAAIADLGELEDAAPPPDGAAFTMGFVLEAWTEDGAPYTNDFDEPVVLTFTIPADTLPDGADLDEFSLVYWDGDEWIAVEAMVTEEDDGSITIDAEVDHFTVFAGLHEPHEEEPGVFAPLPEASGVTLARWSGGGYDLLTAAVGAGNSVWVFIEGEAVGYVVGAAAFSNQPFTTLHPDGLSAGALAVIMR